jgi:hypothetical protein
MVIGQARGILMKRYCIDAQQACSFLRRLSTDDHEAVRTRPCGSSPPALYQPKPSTDPFDDACR